MKRFDWKYAFLSIALFFSAAPGFSAVSPGSIPLWDQVIIHRTTYGVPHIQADNMEAAGYAMGYLQMEDYGSQVVFGLIRARGTWAKFNVLSGNALRRQIEEDASNRLKYTKAVETYFRLNSETRDLLKGFAQGVNRFIELHPEKFPEWLAPNITAYDVHAKGFGTHNKGTVRKLLEELQKKQGVAISEESDGWESDHPEAGSNVWAFAPERTTSGNAILMRNPHLNWGAGYYEAHMNVKGHFNFYGDFRIGEPLGIVGGFNQYLGWSTTNNYTDPDEFYAFAKDSRNADHYLLDGISHALIREQVLVEYKTDQGTETESKTFWSTPYGPVIHQDKNNIYIVRSASSGEFRTNEQFLKMMAAQNLEQWKDAMRMHARYTSNFTYADRDGQIFYVWNATIPALSHPSGGDTTAVFVDKSADIWSELVPWDQLPQLHNPKGGYLRNENDPFHFTNLNEPFHASDFPDYFPKPQLRLRSQLSLELIGDDDKLSLEDVVERKHSMRAILADRVKNDLIQAVEATKPRGEIRSAIAHLKSWDNTIAADSKGGVLFETWWNQYVKLAAGGKKVPATPEAAGYEAPADKLFTKIWSVDAPDSTPEGLASPQLAVEAFLWAIKRCNEQFGSWNLTWGDVHRAKIGEQDYPVGGGTGNLGAFRVLWYEKHDTDPKKLQVTGGDGWVFAVEFGEVPRAYSVLAYGVSNQEDSPYYADQLKMFSENQMKRVVFTEEDIQKATIKSYRPGKP